MTIVAEMQLDPELERALKDGTLIACVGPAPSLAASLPDLASLTEAVLQHALTVDPQLDAASLREWIAAGRATEVLEQLHHRLGDDFQREVERLLSDQGRTLPPEALALAKLRKQLRSIYTLRLDRLIERALAGRWPSFSSARPDIAQRRELVFKLRGTLEFPRSWVLTREQEQRELGPGSACRTILEAAFRAHRLLLLGFSIDDHDLRVVLDMLPTQTDGQGPGHFIALSSCSPLEREQLERRGLRVLIVETLALLEALGGEPKPEERARPTSTACPYPGLESFREDQAELFFGRHAEVSQAAAMLGGLGELDHRWLAIEGPSGVGKSSFARAGVIPALRRGFAAGTPSRWRVATSRPGAAPFEALAASLCTALGLDQDPHALAEQLHQDPRRLTELARTRVGAGEGLLLLVDQLEELVTLTPPAMRSRFGECLAGALAARTIYLVTTVRSDLVPVLQRDVPALAGLLNDVAQRYALPPISRAGLREAICEPAAIMGVRIVPELVERILVDVDADERAAIDSGAGAADETRASAAALPLVAHVLRGLWTPEHVADGVITLDEYLALGGIAGALRRSADGLLASLEPADRERARELFLRLVRLAPDGTATRRVITRSEARELANDHVIDRLSGGGGQADGPSARLLLTRDGQGEVALELVHEALIRDWPALRGWIAEHRDQLLLDEELARQADKWEARGCPVDELPTGRDVVELLGARAQGAERERQRNFQAALRRAELRRKQIRIAVGATLVIAAVGVLGLILRLRQLNSRTTDSTALAQQAPTPASTNGPPPTDPTSTSKTLDPKYAKLLACWFQHPLEGMFDGKSPSVEIAGVRYGTYLGGSKGLLYNGKMLDDRDSTSLTVCAGQVGKKTLRGLDDLSGLEILAGTSATLENDDLGFAAVNPEFVHWARRELLPAPDDRIEGVSVQLTYERVFRRLFRLMAESALLLHEQHDAAAHALDYQTAIEHGADGLVWLDSGYANALPEYAVELVYPVPMQPSHAVGFWLRRQLDESLPACWHGLRELLARYDAEWLAAQEARYPKGWAKLAAVPDPLAPAITAPAPAPVNAASSQPREPADRWVIQVATKSSVDAARTWISERTGASATDYRILERGKFAVVIFGDFASEADAQQRISTNSSAAFDEGAVARRLPQFCPRYTELAPDAWRCQ